MSTVWLGIGSNIDNRISHIEFAVQQLSETLGNISRAELYETAPRDFLDQDDFLNTVLRCETDIHPRELLELIHQIEDRGGRIRSNQQAEKGPRTLDIDILLYDHLSETYTMKDGSDLVIPHQRMHERLFVLKPLMDLDPELVDPRDSMAWCKKASQLEDQQVRLYKR